MQVLLVFNREDPYIITLKNSILKCGYALKCCKNIQETHEAFKKISYDLVFIDCHRGSKLSVSGSTATTPTNTSGNTNNNINQYDYENICRFIRKLYHYTVIVALTHHYDDKDTPSVLPLLKIGFNRTFSETTSLNRCINELLTLELGEVSSVRRLQAAHALFTALEYTSDPIEIMNDNFKLLYVNNAFEKLTGMSLSDICGKDFNDFHRLDSNEQLSKKVSPGNAWECNLLFPKSNGEIGHHLSITIPVIVQGETNKVQNYVTITYLSDRLMPLKGVKRPILIQHQHDTVAAGTAASTAPHPVLDYSKSPETTPIKKQTSFMLPKKGYYDYDRFATISLASTSELEPNSSPLAAIQSITNSIDDSPLYIHNDLDAAGTRMLLTDVSNSPEMRQQVAVGANNLIKRKRSYDIQASGSHVGGLLSSFQPRRHSTTQRMSHQLSIEAPIRKVINLITVAHENCVKEQVRKNLDMALDILKTTELYSPSGLVDNDIHTSDLVSGLMSNGLQRRFQKLNIFEIKQHSFNSASSLSHNYVKNLTPEITELLNTEETWNFDIISLERMTNNRPLVTLGFKIMNRFDVCDYLKIEETVLVNWLTLIESNYRPANPYHNSTHASDVLHATAYFLSTNRVMEILDAGDGVAALIAAAVHDLNHPGRTNAFLCNSNNDLSILYNDQAVLENHHAALAFQLTRQNEDTNIFKNLNRDEYRALRSIIIDMVLATDMSKHFEHLNKFVNKFSDQKATIPVTNNPEIMKQPENKVLIKRILIKCADVSNPCRPLDIYKEWANRIASEYFDQTDEEKNKSLPVVMPTFDRISCNISKAQISFIEYFINDMFEAWDEFTYIPEAMSNLQANTVYWRECAEDLELKKKEASNKPSTPIITHNSSNSSLNRSKSIVEDIENEIE